MMSLIVLRRDTNRVYLYLAYISHTTHHIAWGYGLLAVTVINLTSVLGFFFKPCMNTVIYKKIMMYMVSLAVGTLSGSALVFLIPEVSGDIILYSTYCSILQYTVYSVYYNILHICSTLIIPNYSIA